MKKLSLKNLTINANNKQILKNINLEVKKGEIVLILGPNGHGKSTLFKSIMRHYSTQIVSGKILIDDKSCNEYETNQIANLGIYLANQHPVEIPGLKTLDLLRNEINLKTTNTKVLEMYKLINDKLKQLGLNDSVLNRSVNDNFSGGERKKSEILQMQLLNPDFILLDEIDSGLDTDAINTIIEILKQEHQNNKAIIYISHNDRLLKEIVPDKVYLIVDGSIVLVGDKQLAIDINKLGYETVLKNNNIDPKILSKQQIDDNDLMNTTKSYYCNGK